MPSHFQQTVNILEATEHALGPVEGLSTSATARLKGAFNESPIHSGELTREGIREMFNEGVLNGPANIGPNGEITKPSGAVLDNASSGVNSNGTPGNQFSKGSGSSGSDSSTDAPNIGGETGTPKGPNLLAAYAILSGEATDDGAAVGLGGLTQQAAAVNAAMTSASASASASSRAAASAKSGVVAAGAATAAGVAAIVKSHMTTGIPGKGFGASGENTITGAGAAGAGGSGGSSNPATATKIISRQALGKLQLGSSTPTPCKVP